VGATEIINELPKLSEAERRAVRQKLLELADSHGVKVEDVDWDTQNGRYRVRLNGQWIIVPDNALVTEPNKFGPAVVWPYQDATGATQIRCFIPGSGA